jgi:serine/threonine protein kinase
LLAKLKVEIEGYDLLKRLGQGGQATVYKAIQRHDGRTVAVKVLHAGPHATEEARARLKREINALRAINHPNIVQAIGAGRTRSGLDCLVMNYIDGRPLDHLWSDPAFAAQVAPQAADLLRLYKTICETVQAAHRKGITHRDLSPSNILIDVNGQPHILDFGMASTAFDGIITRDVTLTGQFIGKLKYASPEQARGARTPGAAGEASGAGVDIRSDVYALGVMLYQILTGGAFPYQVVGNVIDVLHNIIHSKPRPPSQTVAELHTPTSAMAAPAPASDPRGSASPAASAPVRRNPPLVNETIEAIVLKALEKDPAQRYQSAGELAADIDRYLAGQPTSAVVWSTRPQPQARFRPFRRSVAVAASIVTVVALVGVIMNTKSVALWLGLATAAAPVLPTDLSPLPVSTAEAAALAAQQPDGSERKLADLAADLAKLDARLRAVHVQLKAATSRKPPELDDRQPGGSGPFPADEFLAALAKSATDTGRPLTFEPLPKADRDRAEQQETSAVERETDQVTLLARRATIDAEQATTWARLAWGTFTGREEDRLFRFQLKKNPTADANMTAKARVLESGVKVRRLAAKAMEQAVTSLRTLDGAADDGPEGASLGTVAANLAAQVGPELANFQKAAGTARDGGALTAEEATAVADLQKQAGRLRDVLEGTAEMHGRAARAADELARFTARDRLQRDLRDTADAAARLDAGLVKLAGEWKFEVDSAAELKEATPPVVRREKRPAEKPADAAAAQLTPVKGDKYSGTNRAQDTKGAVHDPDPINATVLISSPTRIKLETRNNTGAIWTWDFDRNGGEITLRENGFDRVQANVQFRKTTTPGVIPGVTASGTIGVDTITFRFNWPQADLVYQGTFDLKADQPRPKVATADPLAAWAPGSRWTNSTPKEPGLPTWTVVSRDAAEIQIERPSVGGQGTVRVTCSVRGNSLRVINVQHVNTKTVINREPQGSGTINASSMTLTYSVISNNGPRWSETLNLKPE